MTHVCESTCLNKTSTLASIARLLGQSFCVNTYCGHLAPGMANLPRLQLTMGQDGHCYIFTFF